MKEEIIKTERTDKDIDNSGYEIKTPYIHTDDYGNEATFYRKEFISTEQVKDLEKQRDELNAKLEEIDKLK